MKAKDGFALVQQPERDQPDVAAAVRALKWKLLWRGDGEVDFVVEGDRGPIPIQVSWDEPTERARRAVDAFHEAHPTAAEPVFVTAKSLAAGLPELPAPALG